MKSCDGKWVKKISFGLDFARNTLFIHGMHTWMRRMWRFVFKRIYIYLDRCFVWTWRSASLASSHWSTVRQVMCVIEFCEGDIFPIPIPLAPIYFFVSIVSFVWRVRRRLFYVLFAFSSDFFLVIVSGQQFLLSVSVASPADHTKRHRVCVRHTRKKNKRKFFHKYSWHIEATQKRQLGKRNRRRMARTASRAWTFEHSNMRGS